MRTFPFSAVVGSDDMALALVLTVVLPVVLPAVARDASGAARERAATSTRSF